MEHLYQVLFNSWRSSMKNLRPGYTALLTVPHDLPIFLEIALRNIAAQDLHSLVEILVIPDQPSAEFRNLFEVSKKKYELPPLRLIEMNMRDKLVGRLNNTPAWYHFLQLKNGAEAANTTHLLFHDADLFLAPGDFLESRFRECVEKKLSALGVDLPPHRGGNNFVSQYMVATWEMMATREWLMRFKPIQHKSNFRYLDGRKVRFDTTLWPQYQTDPTEFALHGMDAHTYVHFGNIVTTYRKFRRARKPYEDTRFRVLLIRLLIDAMGSEAAQNIYVPSIEECVAGIDGKSRTVSYAESKTASIYKGFRDQIRGLSGLNVLAEAAIDSIEKSIRPFDEAFQYGSHKSY